MLRKMTAVSLCAVMMAPMWGQDGRKPTAEVLAGIAKDNGRHFGDDPEDPGPLAKDLSPAMTRAAIEKAMRKVAEWQLARSEPYFDRIWTWSVLYSGFMATSETLKDAKYRDAMYSMGKKFDWKLRNRRPNADDQSVAQTYLELYLGEEEGKRDRAMILPTQAELDEALATPDDAKRIPWWWCDALFMAPPVWARMYQATGDRKYLDYMHKEWAETYDLLWDKEEHLYARDATYIPKRALNGKKIFWSRGEGWVMGGIVRVLEFLPRDDPRRPFYVQQLRDMAARVVELRDKDGLWHGSLLDAADFPEQEISGSALMTYAMAWGVNEGVLERAKYRPVVEKAWAGMLRHVYADGRLGGIQQTGAEPAFYRASASYTYGVGGFLLAGSEVARMAGGGKSGK